MANNGNFKKRETTGYKSDILGHGDVSLASLEVGALEPREFSTGSVGLNHSGKVAIAIAGVRYNFQVSLNIVVAHSKPDDAKYIGDDRRAAFLGSAPTTLKALGLDTALALARTFNSGKVGFFLNGKTTVNGQPCQVNCSITAIGSDGDGWAAERPPERPTA